MYRNNDLLSSFGSLMLTSHALAFYVMWAHLLQQTYRM